MHETFGFGHIYIYQLFCCIIRKCNNVGLCKGYDPVSNIIRIQSILFIVVNIGRLFGTTLVATGQQVKYTYAVISAAILNFVLNAVFLKFFNLGAIGVSIASVHPMIRKIIVRIIGNTSIFRSIVYWLVTTLCAAIITWIIKKLPSGKCLIKI